MKRLAYQTTDALRRAINDGSVNYQICIASSQYLNYGMIAKPDIAIVEATSIDEEGNIVPTFSN